jgi:phosphoribosylformimino-5-aminoimidazole carboxamide ribotide isomerase
MLILPAIDLRGGQCVRLAQGDFSRETVYGTDAGAVARQFAEAGATWIHVVDLDGARTGEPSNWNLLPGILETGLKVELGGGIRDLARAQAALDLGVSRAVVGSRLVQNEELSGQFFAAFGDRIVAGIDAKEGKVAIDGWETPSEVSAIELAQRVEAQGCKRIILTDIARDGMQTGPNLELLESVAQSVSIGIFQSGGIGSQAHLSRLAESGISNLEGVIVGRAIYEGTVDLAKAIQELHSAIGSAC